MAMRRAFTLLETLVVIAVIALLTAAIIPSLRKVRQQAKVLAVNSDLSNIALALEAYAMQNQGKYPPTRADCSSLPHSYSLPVELYESGYLAGADIGRLSFVDFDDRYNSGHTYKYIAAGPLYDFFGTPYGRQALYIPKGFPADTDGQLVCHDDPAGSPVTWVLFSIGPGFDENLRNRGNYLLTEGAPVAKQFWYSPSKGKGMITRIRLSNGLQTGSFNGENR